MKILFIDHSVAVGGATKVMTNLLTLFDSDKVTPILVCPGSSKIMPLLQKTGHEVHTVSMPWLTIKASLSHYVSYVFYYLSAACFLSKLIFKKDIKIIHANTFIATLYCIIPAFITRRPLIWHMHDILEVNWFYKIFIKISEFASSKIICVSNAVKKNLLEFNVNADKCIVIYNGIRKTKTIPEKNKFRKEFNIDTNTKLVGLIGSITEWKGQHIFIEALPEVLSRISNIKFLIVGEPMRDSDNTYYEKLKSMAKENGSYENLIFTGFREDIPEILADLDLVVHTSVLPDPLPTVILEAMAAEKPVIATNVGGCPEIITHMKNGILVPPANAKELAKASLLLLNDPNLQSKLINESGRLLNKFTPDENLDKVLSVYDALNLNQV